MIEKEKTKFEVALSEIKNFLTLKSGNKEIEKKFFNQLDPITCDTQTRVLFQFDSELQIQKVEVFFLKDDKLFSYLNQLTCDFYYLMNWTHDFSLISLYKGFEKGSQSESVVDGLQLYLNKQIKRFLEEPTKYFLSEQIGFSTNFLPEEVIPEVFEQLTKDQYYRKNCEWFEYSIKKKIKEGKSYKDYNLFSIFGRTSILNLFQQRKNYYSKQIMEIYIFQNFFIILWIRKNFIHNSENCLLKTREKILVNFTPIMSLPLLQ